MWRRGAVGAGSLAVHSFLDGFAIGLAFKVSSSSGSSSRRRCWSTISRTASIRGHRARQAGGVRSAFRWLLVDAAAPVIGAASTLLLDLHGKRARLRARAVRRVLHLHLRQRSLPESYHDHPTGLTTAMTILGIAVVYVAVRLAEGE
jgi:ZIP family zinc transporter